MERAPNNDSPFKENLENISANSERFKKLSNLEGYRIRTELVRMPGAEKIDQFDNRIPFEDLAPAREELRILNNNYGIGVPDFKYVIGKDEKMIGGTVCYTAVEEIEGKNLHQVEKVPPEAAPKFNHFFEQLAQYYVDAYQNKRKFLSDIDHEDQYMYGRTAKESEDKIYLVDIEPHIKEWSAWSIKDVLIDRLRRFLVPWITDTENKFFKAGDLDGAKQKAKEAIGFFEEELKKF